jgi:hypothetical protein
VSGADPIESRPGIVAALARIAGNGVRTIIVETAMAIEPVSEQGTSARLSSNPEH